MSKLHSRIGASSSHRWMNCPGSVAMGAKAPPQESSDFADEGTVAHEICERCLLTGKNAFEYTEEIIAVDGDENRSFEVTNIMAANVQVYVDYVKSVVEDTGGELFVEHKCDLTNKIPELFGTGDAVIAEQFGALHIIDFKYGQGVVVEAKNNSQLRIYGLGCLDLGDFEEVHLTVVQPRIPHEEGPIRTEILSVSELEAWGKENLEPAALEALAMADGKKDLAVQAGDHCKFCPAAGFCNANADANLALVQSDFSDLTQDTGVPDPTTLTDEQLAMVVEGGPRVEKWLKAVAAHALNRLKAGESIAGLKMVEGKSSRKWIDEEKAIAAFARKYGMKEVVNRKIKPLGQLEKLEGSERLLDKHTRKPAGKITVAPESDKRPAFTLPDVADFKPLEEVKVEEDFLS